MNPALILLELCLRTQLYSNFWCNTFLVHRMVHQKLHHSWLVVHHKLHHSWLGVHQKLHHPCYTYQDLSHYFEKNILSVLMKYHKFNAKIWHLITFISIYCSTIVNWNLIMIYTNNGHIWNEINTYFRTRIWRFFFVLRWLEWARNDFYNPELITLMISVINSGL